MSDKRSYEQLDSLRERLYSRGEAPPSRERTPLVSDETSAPSNSWADMTERTPDASNISESSSPVVPKWKYRKILVIVGLAFFTLSIAMSSLYMLLGKNTVSASNISVVVNGPFTVGGGEVLDMQVGITNHNMVAIESATLIIEYPSGTRSADENNRELFTVREPLPPINAGETINLPVKARIFGEENQEATINVSIEYRVANSNATYTKEAEPLRFKIGHSPIVLSAESERAVSSGQETTIKLTVKSNSPMPVYDLVVKADYPSGFDFRRSNPSPQSGRNVWHIKELQPEKSLTIEITGVLVGSEQEKRVIRFSSGVASERDPNNLASVLAYADTEFSIEQPFLSFDVSVNGSRDQIVTIADGSQASISIEMKNNSNNIVYDSVVEIILSGNVLSDTQVTAASGGFYDSNTRTIRYDVSSVPGLERLGPNSSTRFSFNLRPSSGAVQSPQLEFEIRASGKRASEASARQQIAGTIKREIKVESRLAVEAQIIDVVSGPVPPVSGRQTAYRVEWKIKGGNNNVKGAVVTAVLPSYVDWAGSTAGSGAWSYNPSTRTVEWKVDSVTAGGTVAGTFGITFLPSGSQVNNRPTLVERANLQAADSFTDSILRASANALSSEIPGQSNSGTVQPN